MPPLSRAGRVSAARQGKLPPTMPRCRRTLAALVAALVLAAGGCGEGSSISDSKIVSALDLKPAGQGYEIGGDPFCTVGELLNDGDEVDQASDDQGQDFLIASPNGEVGVLAQRPFAPDCTRRARDALKRLARKSE
jgi:hypothetical protein